MTMIAHMTVTVSEDVIMIALVNMEVVGDLVVGSASGVASQGILLGSVPVKVEGMEEGMIGTAAVAAEVAAVMVLTGMEIGLMAGIGMLVDVVEVTDIVVIVLGRTIAEVLVDSDLGNLTAEIMLYNIY